MEKVDHPFLKLNPNYLYKGYRYKLKFYRSESKYNWKRHVYENSKKPIEALSVFSHQTDCYYIFVRPTIRIKKENMIKFEALSYEGA